MSTGGSGGILLRITVNTSASAAKRYFEESLRPGDYYLGTASQDQEAGAWFGEGARLLGLTGRVTRMRFKALCENRLPGSRERLTARSRVTRRVGYDLTFNAPKSMSLLAGLTDDHRLATVFDEAVVDTLKQIEQELRTRVRRDGRDETRVTSNLVAARFMHRTARPVDGWPDPHLHTHCFVFNATWDCVEGRWKAIDLGGIKRDAGYFEACFHARLAMAVRSLGYEVERRGRFWEIAGVGTELISRYSRRTREVETEASRRGIQGDAAAKAALGAKTRASKTTTFSNDQLRELWRSGLSVEECRQLESISSNLRSTPHVRADSDRERTLAAQAAAHALEHHFERLSVLDERRVIETAIRYGLGFLSADAVERAVADVNLLRWNERERTLVSTPEVVAEEQWMLRFAGEGRGAVEPIHPLGVMAVAPSLSPCQRKVVEHLLCTPDRVMLVRGAAGTGKTRLMTEAIRLIERSGFNVTVLAPTAEAAYDVLGSGGFANAQTVARFLIDQSMQRDSRDQVVWVDEAGLVGGPTMAKLFRLAERIGFRVILAGDQRQHHAVERGDSFRLLIEKSGVRPVELSSVRRQHGTYREVAECLARGDVVQAWIHLESMSVFVEASASTLYTQAAKHYVDAVTRARTCLIVSPTHAERRLLTTEVRRALLQAGRLRGSANVVEAMMPANLTVADRRVPDRYHVGQVIRFHLPVSGIRVGQKCVVTKVGVARVEVRIDGRNMVLPLGHAERFAVYQTQALELRPGELIRFTRNLRCNSGRFTNGSVGVVRHVCADGSIELLDGRTVPPGWGHLDHGYVLTSHASQGKTVDDVVIVQTQLSLAATTAEQFYVSVTRGRHSIRVMTDSLAQLRDAVVDPGFRMHAVEMGHRTKRETPCMESSRKLACNRR